MANEDIDEVEVEWEGTKSKLPMVLGALTFLILGGGAGFAGASYESAEEAKAKDSKSTENADGAGSEDNRLVHSLGLFTINLRGTGGGRVLRMEVQIEAGPATIAKAENERARLRDAVITLVSDYSYAEIEGLDGKTRLRDELLTRMNAMLGKLRIERVYFTEFVVQ